ncbi:DUF2515 domain-containing protein [Gracilibacillus oryzae]|uniref:DUF2515 domain-containing protein n=1 Tax=Gracilibacillus oryzae TaxID=1672701 RepID=A0A7C8GS54_9BACI|nr:DUF2515 family protein [Gracilibacillus oryzae]KAB8127475.1 DUF2515 domain-containing protein [Gracilibacillus oryzae]
MWKLSPELKAIKQALKQNKLPNHSADLSYAEEKIVRQIEKETEKHNLNNLTRTAAYLDFFTSFPELEWAFLAHMVSRNAGWNMTDLKGTFLSKLLTLKQQEYFFTFLERSNWLIFQDAYPQLLLYQESKLQQRNLFHLLPQFGVSSFMVILWNHYLQTKNDKMISTALIINEQHYIENRVVHHPDYHATIFESIEFKLQELLELNQILFPSKSEENTNVIGLSVHHFAALNERIELGKKLYQLLFDEENFSAVYDFAINHSHTGSRNDFYPQLFNTVLEETPYDNYQIRLERCQLLAGTHRLYSPRLRDAWGNVPQLPADKGDWYQDWKVIKLLQSAKHSVLKEKIRDSYCDGLKKLELAVLAKSTLTK